LFSGLLNRAASAERPHRRVEARALPSVKITLLLRYRSKLFSEKCKFDQKKICECADTIDARAAGASGIAHRTVMQQPFRRARRTRDDHSPFFDSFPDAHDE
jgi:hypothetical protein